MLSCRAARCCLARLVPVLLLVATASKLGAQVAPSRDFRSSMRTGIGYTAAFPDAIAGAGAWHFLGASPFGVFADAKLTVPSRRNSDRYCPPALEQCVIAWVETERNDIPLRNWDEYLLLNAGGVYAITSEFAFLLGAGVSRWRGVREYIDEEQDPDLRINDTGSYYVDHQLEPDWSAQVVAGMLLRAGRNVAFRFGYESAPGGLSVGAYFVLP